MRDDVCANCGKRIFLIKKGPNLFRWVSDADNPEATEACDEPRSVRLETESGQPMVKVTPRHHAPLSMRESHR